MAKRKKLVVIDSHALIHRAYHAIPPLTTKTGEIVNAVYGFTTILLSVLRDLKPDYVVCAFDLPGKTKRHDDYAEYKANRLKAPDDLISQIVRVRDVVKTFNIPLFEMIGYEADDIIGSIVTNIGDDIESYIVTGDMDELQLVDEKTKVYTMKRGFSDIVIYDEEKVKERYKLTPSEFVDYKALRGDPSDNIPGVAGIGEKTATDLISAYGSLGNVYKNLDKIKPAISEKLKNNKEIAYLSQKLSKIETSLPINIDLKKCVVHEFDRTKVFSLFQELGFKSLLSKIPGTPEIVKVFGKQEEKTKKETSEHINTAKYKLINTEKDFEALCKKLNKQKVFAFDTETDSINEIEANLVGMSFSFSEGEAYYVPISHKNGKNLDKKNAIKMIKPILENEKIAKVGHNIKYDYVVMKNEKITIKPLSFDTMVAAYLINPNARAQRLDELAFTELGLEMIKIEELIGKGKDQITFNFTDVEKAKVYACEDADITYRLYKHLLSDLSKTDLLSLSEKIESPLISILGEMEIAGVLLDINKLAKISKETNKKIIELEENIKKYANDDINISSPLQLQKLLFEKLKLAEKIDDPKDLKKLKSGGYSTSAQELEKLKNTHPIINYIFEYRELTKLKNTYIDALPKIINIKTGRIHTSFNQAITQTGRLSSSTPNLQNIPIRTDTGKKIRESFVAPKGFVLLSADYSQIELRVVAHIANDNEMIKIFNEGRDIHSETAAKVFNVSEKKVTKNMRRIAKVINFGIIYGVSAHGLKQQTGVSYTEGKDLIEKYFNLHPEIKEYSNKMILQAKELGYVETIFGRRRYLPEIKSSNFAVRGSAERMAINMPIQGTAADLMKLAMVDIINELAKISPKTRMILQVHDELVFEVPEKDANIVSDFVRNKMDNVAKLNVPIETSIGWGKNWGSTK